MTLTPLVGETDQVRATLVRQTVTTLNLGTTVAMTLPKLAALVNFYEDRLLLGDVVAQEYRWRENHLTPQVLPLHGHGPAFVAARAEVDLFLGTLPEIGYAHRYMLRTLTMLHLHPDIFGENYYVSLVHTNRADWVYESAALVQDMFDHMAALTTKD